MRIAPPKTNQKVFNGDKEIIDYFYSHKVCCDDGELIPVRQFLLEMIEAHRTPTKALSFFISMFPLEYQEPAYCIFKRFLEEELGVKMGVWMSAEMHQWDGDYEIENYEREMRDKQVIKEKK